MWGFFSLGLLAMAAAIAYLLRRYAAPSVPLIVLATTAYAWAVSMSIVLITPLDVAATLAHEPEPAISTLWKITYWSTQVLTWLVLPFFQVYADAGNFTPGGRALTSLRENGLLYGLAGAAGVVGLVAIVVVERSLRPSDLAALGMALSNTFGLCAGILLMGYGLVEVPRGLWKSDPAQQLKWCAHRAGRFACEVVSSTNELERVVTIIVANDKQMPRRDPLRKYMEVITSTAEAASPVKPSALLAASVDLDGLAADDLEYNYDMAGLAALRRRLIAAVHDFDGAHAQYEEVIRAGLLAEAVIKARAHGMYGQPPAAVGSGAAGGAGAAAAGLLPTAAGAAAGGGGGAAGGLQAALQLAVWRWRCVAEPAARKVAAAALAALSVVVIWSEATIFTGGHPDLSPFSRMIRSVPGSAWGMQLLVMWPLAYICACTYTALFRLNAFNYNKLVPRTSTGAALMQNGSLMARFAAPTCWNLLHMVHMDGRVDAAGATTVFTQNMGTMVVLPVLGKHLNTYLPLLLALHCGLVWARLWDRLVGACVGAKYRFTDDDADDQYTEVGRSLIRREGEGVAAGLRIGEVLAAGDLALPGGVRRTPAGGPRRRGLFALLGRGGGGGQQQQQDAGPGAAAGITSSSTAAAGGGGRAAERSPMLQLFAGARSDDLEGGGSARGGLLSSLVKNKHTSSPQGSDGDGGAGGGAGGGGLDGIFAELNTGSRAPARPQWRPSNG